MSEKLLANLKYICFAILSKQDIQNLNYYFKIDKYFCSKHECAVDRDRESALMYDIASLVYLNILFLCLGIFFGGLFKYIIEQRRKKKLF